MLPDSREGDGFRTRSGLSVLKNPLAPLYRLSDRLRGGDTGRRGEDAAHRWLRARGFVIAARNWRPPQGGGEIDIVAWDGAELVFVEVKTRREHALSAPERAIGEEKERALRRSAQDYVRRSGADPAQVRFDVIAIEGKRIDHLRNAFRL